jgi:hypothetical protein
MLNKWTNCCPSLIRNSCNRCGSFAINPHTHGRQAGEDLDLCDVCYWRKRYEDLGSNLVKKLNAEERDSEEKLREAGDTNSRYSLFHSARRSVLREVVTFLGC